VFHLLFRALSSFDELEFGAVKQNLDSSRLSVAGISMADIDTCTELLAGRSWLSASDALELAQYKLLRAVTAVHVENDSDDARLVFLFSTNGSRYCFDQGLSVNSHSKNYGHIFMKFGK